MTSTLLLPPPSHLTEEEVEVVGILCELHELISESSRNDRGLSLSLHWGSRSKRSALSDSHASPRANHKSAAAASPTTPLSFDPAAVDERLRPAPPPKPFKNAKSHHEWVKQKSQQIAILSAEKVNLERAVMDAQRRLTPSKARNSYLKDIRSKMQQQQMRPPPPAPARANAVGQHAVPAFLAPSRPEIGRCTVVPDLNSTAEEEGVGLELGLGLGLGFQQQQQQQQGSNSYRAMASQARKRRIELKREKGLSSTPVMCKAPRLR